VKAYTELEREGVIEMRHGKGAFVSARARAITGEEQENALRRSAKQLVVEATQMQVTPPRVITVVREELNAVNPSPSSDQAPVKFTVVPGR
jgi:DNA-binding transcriptional regulator YhcF (GntR family)